MYVIECRNKYVVDKLHYFDDSIELTYFVLLSNEKGIFSPHINNAEVFENLYDARQVVSLFVDDFALCVVNLEDEKNGLFKTGTHYVIQNGELSRVAG